MQSRAGAAVGVSGQGMVREGGVNAEQSSPEVVSCLMVHRSATPSSSETGYLRLFCIRPLTAGPDL